MIIEEINEEFDWSTSLKILFNYDPCYEYCFHKAYADHMKAEKIIMLKITEENKSFIYPFLLFRVPKYLSKEDLYYASSVYGFTGPMITYGQKDFIKNAFNFLEIWLKKNKVVAEFIRISPFNHKSIEILKEQNYTVENNRELSIWDTNSLEDKYKENYYTCNMSRRALRLGAKFKKIPINNLNDFKEIYHQTMNINKADNFFNYDDNYFETLLNEKMKSKNHLYGVYKESKITSAAWFISNEEYAYYHLGCSNRTIQGVSDLVLKEGIKDLVYQGVKKINLTGGRTTLKDDPLLKFKKRMGNTIENFYIAKRSINKKVYIQLVTKYLEIHASNAAKKFIPWD